MIFSSVVFLFYFFPAVFILYYLFFFSRTLQNVILLAVSLVFYAWGEPKAVFIMLGSIAVNYMFGLLAEWARRREKYGKAVIAADVAINVGVLFLFKYLVFTVKTVNELGGSIPVPDIVLPIGISFYTFQAISYVVDVYRGNGKVQYNPLNVGLYIAFFPQLISGPIVRYSTFAAQLKDRKETFNKITFGACRFIVGLGKKVLIANQMAIVADRLIDLQKTQGLSVASAWIGAIAYMLQIYFDFSGYSDMAIGLGLMFGFKFERNFNYPYISKSIGEFWRRWHISLGTWFRDYVYIPLGGSWVKNRDILLRNLAIVWLLTGIWHGANWTFLCWGILNMIFIIGEKLLKFEQNTKIPNTVKHIYAMLVVCIGWVLFRADTLQDAGSYIGNMFNLLSNPLVDDTAFLFVKEFFVFFLAAIVFSMPVAAKMNDWMTNGISVKKIIQTKKPYKIYELNMEIPLHTLLSVLYPVVMTVLFLVSVAYLVKGNYNPFIYFKF